MRRSKVPPLSLRIVAGPIVAGPIVAGTILACLVAAGMAGCSTESGTDAITILRLDNQGPSPATLRIAETEIEVAADLKQDLAVRTEDANDSSLVRFQFGTVPVDSSGPGVWLRGHAVTVQDGALIIGDRSYGPVPVGSSAKVSADGVRVGQETRGPLPAPK